MYTHKVYTRSEGKNVFTPMGLYLDVRSIRALLLKLSRQDSFGTPVGVRLSFLYPSPMRGAACHRGCI